MNDTGRYHVRTRYGWGWEVVDPNGLPSFPIESAIAAQLYADARNDGKDHTQAKDIAGLRFHGGRLYGK